MRSSRRQAYGDEVSFSECCWNFLVFSFTRGVALARERGRGSGHQDQARRREASAESKVHLWQHHRIRSLLTPFRSVEPFLDAQGLRKLAPVLREQHFSLEQLLFLLPDTVALPRLSQAQKQLRRVRLLGSVNMAFELLTEAARLAVGFHLAHYNLPAKARAATSPCPALISERHRLGLCDSPAEVESGRLSGAARWSAACPFITGSESYRWPSRFDTRHHLVGDTLQRLANIKLLLR